MRKGTGESHPNSGKKSRGGGDGGGGLGVRGNYSCGFNREGGG